MRFILSDISNLPIIYLKLKLQMSFNRQEQFENLADSYDICVIGGGATGAGVALDATLRGYKVIVIEKGDFASQTSSKSTKLVHGGVR